MAQPVFGLGLRLRNFDIFAGKWKRAFMGKPKLHVANSKSDGKFTWAGFFFAKFKVEPVYVLHTYTLRYTNSLAFSLRYKGTYL